MDKKLTPREQEILNYMTLGLTNEQIAQKACVSITTVKAHLKSIYKKLGITNRIQAVIYAFKNSVQKS